MGQKRISFKEYLLFIEAWFFLAIARSILIFIPFKRIAPLLGRMKQDVSNVYPDRTIAALPSVKISILRGSKYSPWRTKCFEQAIAAKFMLRMRGIKSLLYLGVFKGDKGMLKAHAWLTAGDIVVTGGPDTSRYTVVNWFGS